MRLIYLAAQKDVYVSARVLAEKQNMPYQFVRGITKELVKHKLIVSKEGARGGLKIQKDSAKIKVSDVIRIFQGEIELSDCMFQKEVCPNRKTCVLRKEIKRIEGIVEKEFGKITIKGLLTQAQKK